MSTRMPLMPAALAIAVATCAHALFARELWLNDAEIVAEFHDATLDGTYADGRTFSEKYRPDGGIEYVEYGAAIGGYWSVTAGTLCTIYETSPSGGCFRVARVAANCFEFYFASRTEQTAPGPDGARPRWTARGSLRGKDEACPEAADALLRCLDVRRCVPASELAVAPAIHGHAPQTPPSEPDRDRATNW